jgi:hypothetical protein
MAVAYVEPADDGWGPVRILLVQLERLGYRVEEHRILGRPLLYLS